MTAPEQARRVLTGSPGAAPLHLARDLLLIALVPASLLSWLALHPRGCLALMCLPPVAALLYRNSVEIGGFHRTVIADAYAERGSWAHGLIRGRLRLRLVAVVTSVLLTSALFTLATTSSPQFLIVLLLNPLAVLLLYFLTSGVIAPRLRLTRGFAGLFTKRQVVLLDAGMLFGLGVALRLFEPVPSYLVETDGASEAIRSALRGVGSACPWIDAAVRLAAEIDVLQWRILTGSTLTDALPALFGWVVWLTFLVGGGLIAAAYSKACVEAISLTTIGSRERGDAHGS